MKTTHYGTWISYAGSGKIWLAVVLLVIVACVALAGARLPLPVSLPRPPRAVAIVMLLAWTLVIVTFLVCLSVYIQQLQHVRLAHAQAPPSDPISPVTFTAVVVTFLTVLIASPRSLGRQRLTSAVFAALAAPMIFELPFDLIVMTRTYPPVPPDPALYRFVFFAPLIGIELTTLALLSLAPMARLTRPTFYSFAALLAVFAVWALTGFGYPSGPLPITFNVISKILAFVTVLTVFLRRRAAGTSDPAGLAGLAGEALAESR